ncbi:MAG: DUF1611 domain-containing protein [Cytophagales bacterium]|nr:MAG: DUF1611 domain-containing protein [Cytophagales bacterium]
MYSIPLSAVSGSAVLLTQDLFKTKNAKTAHGLVRGSERFQIWGVIDQAAAGNDAGMLLDGIERGIPIEATINDFLVKQKQKPDYVIIGAAFHGGRLPQGWEEILLEYLEKGISIVNGLHDLLSHRPSLVEAAKKYNAKLIDVRKPLPFEELHFWNGSIFDVKVPIVASLGIDCNVGKMTTCRMLLEVCREANLATEMIYTGQTGWMQGYPYGFIFDATLNDFVSGELENAIVQCHKDLSPDLILLEGQSGLRNPSGPCGAELILSGNAKGVVLQYTPFRGYYDGCEAWDCQLPDVLEEVSLIEKYGAEVLAITLNGELHSVPKLVEYKHSLMRRTAIPIICPLEEGGMQAALPHIERYRQRFLF